MKKLLWISTGGTISCIKGKYGLMPAADTEQMTDMLRNINCDADIQCLMNIDSSNISCARIKQIGEAVHRGITDGYKGIIITHGTDTMAYTAAVLNKMLENAPVPVIITGSQRPFYADNSDGKANLSNAFKAAEDNRFKGVRLLFGNKLCFGDKAYKAYSASDNAFISPEGYAAIITDDGFTDVSLSQQGEYCFHNDFSDKAALIKLTPCTQNGFISAVCALDIKGLIIEGYGCGGIPERLLPEIKAAAQKGVKIILISQCFYEGVFLDIYEVGANAAECGVISGGKMTAEAALAEIMFLI